MTLATMTDRSLPLAERVAAMLSASTGMHPMYSPTTEESQAFLAALTELLADIAAADRLARADRAVLEAALRGEPHSPAKRLEYETAMDAYRARMAQGVGRG